MKSEIIFALWLGVALLFCNIVLNTGTSAGTAIPYGNDARNHDTYRVVGDFIFYHNPTYKWDTGEICGNTGLPISECRKIQLTQFGTWMQKNVPQEERERILKLHGLTVRTQQPSSLEWTIKFAGSILFWPALILVLHLFRKQ